MIIFHADDYGVNPNQSKRILSCASQGCLSSISIIPNTVYLDTCIDMIPDNIMKAVHLNFVEGKSLEKQRLVRNLTDDKGIFNKSFFWLFCMSFIKGDIIREEIKRETKMQIEAIRNRLPTNYKLRVDSHQHYHMIPSCFRGIMEAIQEMNIEVENIRFPVDGLSKYFRHPEIWKYIRPINIIKIIVLDYCALCDKKIAREFNLYEKCKNGFFGLMFTTEMSTEKILPILEDIRKNKKGFNQDIEVLFHPGGIKVDEYFIDKNNKDLLKFYTSKNRWMEARTLKEIKSHGY